MYREAVSHFWKRMIEQNGQKRGWNTVRKSFKNACPKSSSKFQTLLGAKQRNIKINCMPYVDAKEVIFLKIKNVTKFDYWYVIERLVNPKWFREKDCLKSNGWPSSTSMECVIRGQYYFLPWKLILYFILIDPIHMRMIYCLITNGVVTLWL